MPLPKSGANEKTRHLKTRRGYKGKFKVEKELTVVNNNCNGIMSKLASLSYLISELKPSIITLQETKLKQPGKLRSKGLKDYVIFELCRKNSQGGGLATVVEKSLNPVFISEGDDKEEILVVQIHVNNVALRIFNLYGPQETEGEKKHLFWSRSFALMAICIAETK